MDGCVGSIDIQLHETAKKQALWDGTEKKIGVGDGRLLAPHAIGGGTGLGARRPGTDPERSSGIGPGDAAASRSDCVHCHGRHPVDPSRGLVRRHL